MMNDEGKPPWQQETSTLDLELAWHQKRHQKKSYILQKEGATTQMKSYILQMKGATTQMKSYMTQMKGSDPGKKRTGKGFYQKWLIPGDL